MGKSVIQDTQRSNFTEHIKLQDNETALRSARRTIGVPGTLDSDIKMLDALFAKEEIQEYLPGAFRKFSGMLSNGYALSLKQHEWVADVYAKYFGEPVYQNLISTGRVPRGREVPTPPVLQNLPLKPPGR
jgi:hypothetical protein